MPLVTSPLIGFTVAFTLVILLLWVFRCVQRRPLASGFRKAQVVSAGIMAFAHGSNDAQKSMGIITLALVAAGILPNADTVPVGGDRSLRHHARRAPWSAASAS